MPFDKSRAEITDDQMAFAEAIDYIYEVALNLGDGIKFGDFLTVPQLVAPVGKIIKLVAAAGGPAGIVLLLVGAAAAFSNDNRGRFNGV